MNECSIGLQMTGRQRKRSEVAYCSLRYAFRQGYLTIQISPGYLIKSGEGFAGVSWSIVNFFAVVGRSLYKVRWQLPLEFYSLIIQSSRIFAFSYFRYCNNYCGAWWSIVCMCVCCMCASVASIRVEIVSGRKKSEMDADYAAIFN